MTRSSPVSSLSTRYLPRRATPVTFAPSSLVMKSFFGCRRIVRVPVTWTVLIRLPTTSRSSPLRMVSTSGSSGNAGLRLVHAVELLAQLLPGRPRRGRFRLLLRPSLAAATRRARDRHGGEEPLRVVGAFVGDGVTGQVGEGASDELLQARLVVLSAWAFARAHDAFAQQVHHDVLRRRPSTGEIDRTEDGLERVGEDRR